MTPSPSLTGCMDDDVGTGATRLGSAVSSPDWSSWHVRNDARERIWARDIPICVYCFAPVHNNHRVGGTDYFSLEHIEAQAEGGTHDDDNLAVACKRCNSNRQHIPFLFWLLKLNSQVSDSERSSYVPTDGDNQP